MRKYILFIVFLCMHYIARGQTDYTYSYWFDNDYTTCQSASTAEAIWHLDIDISTLKGGLHTLHLQVTDNEGKASAPQTRYFVSIPTEHAMTARLWFDNDYSTMKMVAIDGNLIWLDAMELMDGIHKLHVQADGTASTTPKTSMFVKVPQTIGFDKMTCLLSVDGELFKKEEVSSSGGILSWELDASGLSQGIHRAQVQVVTPTGAATSVYDAFFLRATLPEEFASVKCVYCIDGNESYSEAGMVSNGLYHFDLDFSSLDDGLHRITYTLNNGNGLTTNAQTRFFVKIPSEGTGIARYKYWLNDQEDKAVVTNIDPHQDVVRILSLLPLEPQPIRSSCFQFEVEDGNPVIYAKNDFNIYFYDASHRFADMHKQFVDNNVKQEVTDVEWLVPGVRATAPTPEENAIKWYKLTAVKGDSLSFKTHQACTLQLFSPSGEELYSAKSPEVLNFGGCYANEDGTYYVAVHDVMSKNNQYITVEYEHLDKYAVLSHTPTEAGISNQLLRVDLSGNGFDKLVKAQLVMDDTEIDAERMALESKAESSVYFRIQGDEPTGQYDLVLDFSDDEDRKTLRIENAILLKVADWSDITVDVAMSRTTANPYPVTIIVKNNGNVTRQLLPLNIGFDNENIIEQFSLTNFSISISPEENKDSLFVHSDDLGGTGVHANIYNLLIPEIGPGETKRYIAEVTVPSQTPFNLYAWTGQAINESQSDSDPAATNIPSVWDYLELMTEGELSRQNLSAAELFDDVMDLQNGEPYTVINSLRAPANEKKDSIPRVLPKMNVMAFSGYRVVTKIIDKRSRTPRSSSRGGSYQVVTYSYLRNPFSSGGRYYWPVERPKPSDPNDILGYTAESGSKYMKEGTTDVYYTIEFENDPKIANASAHTIVVKDTLDISRFDLSTFAATGVKIGEAEMELNKEKSFSKKTMDLRPAIDVVAQVSLSFDEQKGIATWTIESLDPMSMEPTEDAMQGVLPVNVNGNGQGELMFSIKLKPGMVEGESVSNRAGIVFDQEDVIMTPAWTNTVDATNPESGVASIEMATDTTVVVHIEASDELSKPWKYDLYVQENNDGAWRRTGANIPVDSLIQVKVYEGISYGFYAVVTDSAGNVEQKEAAREYTFEVFGSQIDTDTKIELAEGWNWMSHNQEEPLMVAELQSAGSRMLGQTEELYEDARFGWMGDLEELLPTQMYKLQMDGPLTVQLSGRLFNAGFRAVPLYEGWNWMGYPVARTMTPAEALAKLEAEEGDMLIGQDGMATYSDGQWTGTLMEMNPGQGYMFRSQSDKNLFLNATAQASSRRANSPRRSSLPDDWTVNKRKYPNVMGMIAQLWHDDALADSGEWQLGAFCGDECRGVAQTVGDGEPDQTVLMMNVYGTGSEPISFRVMNRETGEVLDAAEQESFRADVIGSMQQPYALHIGEKTGVRNVANDTQQTQQATYDLQGRRVEAGQTAKGIYVVTDGRKNKTQKVVKR